jgi:hypothetical protein
MTRASLLWVLGLWIGLGTSGARAQESWRLIDGVAMQAGDEILTLSDFQSQVDASLRGRSISTREELAGAIDSFLAGQVALSLEAQAGRELGIEPERVGNMVQRNLAERRREYGISRYLEFLEERGMDALTVEEGEADKVYQWLWRERTLGRSEVSGARPVHDYFVRPGTMRASYRQNLDELGEPDRVRLQILDHPAAAAGGVEQARQVCETARGRAAAGEDFGELVLEFGASNREALGITEWIPVPALIDEELRAFAARASEDDISTVLPIVREGETVGFLVARLEAKEAGAAAPPFTDRRMQQNLAQLIRRKQERILLGQARLDLEREAYVWRNPALAGPPGR